MNFKKYLTLMVLSCCIAFLVTNQYTYAETTNAYNELKTEDNNLASIAKKIGVFDLSRTNLRNISSSEFTMIRALIERLPKDKKCKVIINENYWDDKVDDKEYNERIEELKDIIEESKATLVMENVIFDDDAQKVIEAVKLARQNKILMLGEIDLNKASDTALSLIEAGILYLARDCSHDNQLQVLLWSSDLANERFLKIVETASKNKKSAITFQDKRFDCNEIRRVFATAYNTKIIDLRSFILGKLEDFEWNALQRNILQFIKTYHSTKDEIKILTKTKCDKKYEEKLLKNCDEKQKKKFKFVTGDGHYDSYLDKVLKGMKETNIIDLTGINFDNLSEKEREKYEKKINKKKSANITTIKITFDNDKKNKKNDKSVKISLAGYEHLIKSVETSKTTDAFVFDQIRLMTGFGTGKVLTSVLKLSNIKSKNFVLYTDELLSENAKLKKLYKVVEVGVNMDGYASVFDKIMERIDHAIETKVIDLEGFDMKNNENMSSFIEACIKNFIEENKNMNEIRVLGSNDIEKIVNRLNENRRSAYGNKIKFGG